MDEPTRVFDVPALPRHREGAAFVLCRKYNEPVTDADEAVAWCDAYRRSEWITLALAIAGAEFDERTRCAYVAWSSLPPGEANDRALASIIGISPVDIRGPAECDRIRHLVFLGWS